MSRTTQITLTNRTPWRLYFMQGDSTEGPQATASAAYVDAGDQIVVTATNTQYTFGGNEGWFDLVDSTTHPRFGFHIYYTHPQGTGDSSVYAYSTWGDALLGVDQQTYTGDPITPKLNLYNGVPVSTGDGPPLGYVVPVGSSPYTQANNCQDLINSVFEPNVRSAALVTEKYNQPSTPYQPADFTGGQLGTIVAKLKSLWNSAADPDSTNPDKLIIDFLKAQLGPSGAPPMSMWIPRLTYRTDSEPAAYNCSSYTGYSFMSVNEHGYGVSWTSDVVQNFLTLLAGGAHFVWISADKDFENQGLTNPGRDLYKAFRDSTLPQRGDNGSSHYVHGAPFVNVTGQYYRDDITGEFAPAGCGFLVALLFGRTVNSATYTTGNYNTFMQLEGWPSHGTGGTRHSTDYAAYQQSLWNISTYGASPYSEKRGTTIFLAPSGVPGQRGWNPSIYQTTRMMPYVGAYATGTYPNGEPQPWLHTSLLGISESAPQLPSKYYT